MDNYTDDMGLKECSVFIQNCAKKYKIKSNFIGLGQLAYIGETALLINYLADIQLIIVKRHLENKNGRKLLDEDVYEFASKTNPTLIDNVIGFSIDNLTEEDVFRISQDFKMIIDLYNRNTFNLLNDSKVETMIHQMQKNNIKIFSAKKSCIENIRTKKQLNELGLQEYVSRQIADILKQEVKEEKQDNYFHELMSKIDKAKDWESKNNLSEDNEFRVNKR